MSLPENINIRIATAGDAAQISEIYRYYVEQTVISFETVAPDVYEMQERIERLVRDGFPYIVAEQEGRIVGYAYAHLWKERAAYKQTWETTVYVDREYSSAGIGHRLMKMLIQDARTRGCHALIACITAENTRSRHFHEQLGFRLVSEFHQVGFKHDRYLDVTDYELLL